MIDRPIGRGQALGKAVLLVLVFCVATAAAGEPLSVAEVPALLREELALAPFYAKCVPDAPIPVLGSQKVSDYALLEAAWLVERMLSGREDLAEALRKSRTRLAVMAHDEFTTDVPEHSDLTPPEYWNKRARGLGATRRRPAVSCGEENLLSYPGDPYVGENILIHEFAHAIHEMGLNSVDETFDARLAGVYAKAMETQLWKGTYAATNKNEYWAEGVQSWFNTNRVNTRDHNHVGTREQLKEYDPALAGLIAEVFGDDPWVYSVPAERSAPGHLDGYRPEDAPRFTWPDHILEGFKRFERGRRD
ncbi:MAG: hypothetical protein WD847_17845 [Pirellulales bacterium]